ncbi:MAG: hypothetical protein E6I87_13825 [Chloroflexi bacterium]|nr:MAG: hypothetical protein E6I87_13825 [Chloroflexota bacterium]
MRFPRKRYDTNSERSNDFLTGAVVWGIANLVLGVVASLLGAYGLPAEAFGVLVLVGNILYLLYFGQTRPWFAFGAIGCLGALLLLSFAAFAFVATVCGTGLTPA